MLSIESSPADVSIQPATDVAPQTDDDGRLLTAPSWATTDMQAHTDALHWDVYEHPDEPARFRMQNAKHI